MRSFSYPAQTRRNPGHGGGLEKKREKETGLTPALRLADVRLGSGARVSSPPLPFHWPDSNYPA